MRHVRIGAGVRAATAIAALALPLAMAGTAFASPPGDNGDVKIHKVGTPAPEEENQPHVCHFYLDAFNFDTSQKVHWEIDEWAGGDGDAVKGKKAAEGDITMKSGDGSTEPISLPDGHYKLFWNFDAEHGAAKHKVFWVECASPTPSTPGSHSSSSSSSSSSPSGSGSSPSGSTSSSLAGSTTGGTTGGTTGSPTGTPSASATDPTSAKTSSSSGGSLAHTGAGGVLYIAIGAAALGGGGFALRRYAVSRAKG